MIEKVLLIPIDNNELETRIALNFKRLSQGDYYHDGRLLCPIIKYYKVPKEVMETSKQRILF